jgi:general secretion pathway protein G
VTASQLAEGYEEFTAPGAPPIRRDYDVLEELATDAFLVLDPAGPGPGRGRRGFTLIELMVVIVIIAILVALFVPAITGAVRTARNAAVGAEMQTLSQSLAQFRVRYGDTPPSRILLCEDGHYSAARLAGTMFASANGTAGADITARDLGRRTITYLRKFWPRVKVSESAAPVWTPADGRWYDFNGNGVFDPEPYVLEGDEAMVFWLGGIPLNTGSAVDPNWSMSGFGNDPTNPFTNNLNNNNPMYSASRAGPMHEFRGDRLRDMDDPANDPVRFPSYHDGLGTDTPIAYFSAYGSEGYDPNDCNWAPLDPAGKPTNFEVDDSGAGPLLRAFRVTFPVVDASGTPGRIAISAAPNPYTASTPLAATAQWHKGQSFQLISAGRDGLWGQGGMYDVRPATKLRLPENPAAEVRPAGVGRTREYDNIGNFASGTLD